MLFIPAIRSNIFQFSNTLPNPMKTTEPCPGTEAAMPCFECESGSLIRELRDHTIRHPKLGEITIPDVPVFVCDSCGEQVIGEGHCDPFWPGKRAERVAHVLRHDPGKVRRAPVGRKPEADIDRVAVDRHAGDESERGDRLVSSGSSTVSSA